MKKLENIYEHEGVFYKRVEAENRIYPCRTCCFHRGVDDDRDVSCLLSFSKDFLCNFDDSAVYVPVIGPNHLLHVEQSSHESRVSVRDLKTKLRKKITLRRKGMADEYHRNSIEEEIAEINSFVKEMRNTFLTETDARVFNAMKKHYEELMKNPDKM
jgi:hypothetical protein